MQAFSDGSFASGGRFKGLNLTRSPFDLAPGELTEALNMALDVDDICVRPGAQGKLSASLAAEIFALTPFTNASFLFVAGGKLYKWASASPTSATEILLGGSSLSLTGAGVQLAMVLGVGFLIDGAGSLKRTDGSTATALTELSRPATAPTVAKTYRTILDDPTQFAVTQFSVGGSWATPAASGNGQALWPYSSILDADKNFWHGGATGGTAFWNFEANATCSPNILTMNGDACVELDSDAGTHEWAETDLCTLNSNARVFEVRYTCAAEDPPSAGVPTEQIDLIVTPYNASSAAITEGIRRYRSPYVDKDHGAEVRVLVDWRDLATVPVYYKLKWEQPHIHTTGNQGTDVNHVEVYFSSMGFSYDTNEPKRLTLRQGGVQVWGGAGAVASGQGQVGGIQDGSTNPPGRLLTAGCFHKIPLASSGSVDLTATQVIGIELYPGSGVSGLRAVLGFNPSVGDPTWSDPLDIPQGGGWSTVDIRAIASGLSDVTQIWIKLLDDVFVDGLQEGGQAIVCQIGAIRDVGNLPVGRPVWYKLVEMDVADDATNLLDVVWSDGSPSTQLLEATEGERMGKLTLPARTNSGAEYFGLYRFGGGFLPQSAGEVAAGRLLCLIQWSTGDFAFGSDTDKGVSPRIVALGNPFVSWDKTGGAGDAGSILIDNTPDSWLTGADLYSSGREQAPTTPKAVTAWDNRLWLASGSELFASWRISAGATAGLYWSRLQLPESADPEASIKGHWEKLLLPSGDSIQRLIALPDELVVLTNQCVFVVARSGEAVPAYRVRRIRDLDIVGPTGHLAACSWGGQALWLGHDGLRATDGVGVDRVFEEIRGAIEAATEAERTAARLSSTPKHLLLHLGSYLYIYYAREGGWVRWDVSAKHGAELAGVLYLAGSSGQIFAMTGSGDKALSASGVTAVSASVGLRQVGEGGVWMAPDLVAASIYTSLDTDITVTVTGDVNAAASSKVQSIDAGEKSFQTRLSRSAGGLRLATSFSFSTTGTLRLRGARLTTQERRPLR